jgi:hypothetical protein
MPALDSCKRALCGNAQLYESKSAIGKKKPLKRRRMTVNPKIAAYASSSIPQSQADPDLASRVLDSLTAAVAVIDNNLVGTYKF